MVRRRKLLSWSLPGLLALLAGLSVLGDGQAGEKPKPQQPAPQKPAPYKPKPVPGVTEERKFKETQVLRKAYVYLLEANHDYAGHRARAMRAVKDAGLLLDESIMKHGSAKLKAAMLKEKAVVARAEEVAANTPVLHEPQPTSDKQLRLAAEVLGELRPTLVKHNQPRIINHVDTALKEIKIALKIPWDR